MKTIRTQLDTRFHYGVLGIHIQIGYGSKGMFSGFLDYLAQYRHLTRGYIKTDAVSEEVKTEVIDNLLAFMPESQYDINPETGESTPFKRPHWLPKVDTWYPFPPNRKRVRHYIVWTEGAFWAYEQQEVPKEIGIRKGVKMQQQVIPSKDRARQFNMFRGTKEIGVYVDDSGVKLSGASRAVFQAIHVALNEEGFIESDGELHQYPRIPTYEKTPEGWQAQFHISLNYLLHWSGHERGTNGRYQTRDKMAVKKAIESLGEIRHNFLVEVDGEMRMKNAALFSYEYDTLAQMKEGKIDYDYNDKSTRYFFKLHPLVTQAMGSNYSRHPKDLIREVRQAKREVTGKAVHTLDYEISFCDWLFLKTGVYKKTNKSVKRDRLALSIGLGELVTKRGYKGKIDKRIDLCARIAMSAGYLTQWERVNDTYFFKINEKYWRGHNQNDTDSNELP